VNTWCLDGIITIFNQHQREKGYAMFKVVT